MVLIKQITPKDFFIHSLAIVRYTFFISLILVSLSVLFFILFLSVGRVYKDIFGKSHYQVRYRGLDIVNVCSGFLALITLSILMFYNVRIFGFKNNRITITLFILYTITIVCVVGGLVFLLINFCNDPQKMYDAYGKCVCRNNLLEIDGKCGCPAGTYELDNYCLTGCRSSDDCKGAPCVGGYCCPPPYIECGDQCCSQKDCIKGVCCGDPKRQCIDETQKTTCCLPQEECSSEKKCEAVCGPPGDTFPCPPGQSCLQMQGDPESLQSFQSSLPKEQKSVIDGDELYYCASPPKCSLDPQAAFIPPSRSNTSVTFYPCYRIGGWKDIKEETIKPEDKSRFTPVQLNICVPIEKDATFDTYAKCWQKIRPEDERSSSIYDCKDECEIVNALRDASKDSERINQAIAYEFIKNDPDGEFLGNYCGETAARIRTVRFSDSCKTPMDRAQACLQGGVYKNSKYVFFDNDVCNTYFDCTETSVKASDSDPFSPTGYFDSYQYQNETVQFPNFSIQPVLTTNAGNVFVDYTKDCPKSCEPVRSEIWPDSSQFCECPGDLKFLENQRTGREGDYIYDTDLCTKTGYLVHKKLEMFDLVCDSETSCRRGVTTDEYLKRFSSDQDCISYCANVIFSATWYPFSVFYRDNEKEFRSTAFCKFDEAGDFSGIKKPVIANKKRYDFSMKPNGDYSFEIDQIYLNGRYTPHKNGDRFLKDMMVFYIEKDQQLCPSGCCVCDRSVVGDGPNENLPPRELLKSDRFVLGTSTAGTFEDSRYWWLFDITAQAPVQGYIIPWTFNCDASSGSPYFICNYSATKDASYIEPFFLRFGE